MTDKEKRERLPLKCRIFHTVYYRKERERHTGRLVLWTESCDECDKQVVVVRRYEN
jgi:hypothetical protein